MVVSSSTSFILDAIGVIDSSNPILYLREMRTTCASVAPRLLDPLITHDTHYQVLQSFLDDIFLHPFFFDSSSACSNFEISSSSSLGPLLR